MKYNIVNGTLFRKYISKNTQGEEAMERKKEQTDGFNKRIFAERLSTVTNNEANYSVAEKIGVQAPTLSKWRNISDNAVPSLKGLLALSREYGCSIDYLVGNDTEKQASPRQLCELLLVFLRNTSATITSHFDKEPPEDSYTHGELRIKMEYLNGIAEEEDMGNWRDELIIDFFCKYLTLKNVPGLPPGTLEMCTKQWLDGIDEAEADRKEYEEILQEQAALLSAEDEPENPDPYADI